MKKLLYFDFFADATSFYRLAPLRYLNSDEYAIIRSTETDISFMTLLGYDLIILERPSSESHLNIIKLAKDMHIKVIADYDDDCLHLDEYNPMYKYYQNDKQNIVECLSLCDEIWVSTAGIKKSFSFYNRNIKVIPNAHDDYIFKVKDKKPFDTETRVAMWRGGHTHIGDMYDPEITEPLVEMINKNQDWTFKFLGQRFKYMEKRCGKNYHAYEESISPIQFYKMMHDLNPNIFFYPLENTVFNKSKSNCSWLEATYAGASFFGNKSLPEFDKIQIYGYHNNMLKTDMKSLKIANDLSWEYILENLLVSHTIKQRNERILANI